MTQIEVKMILKNNDEEKKVYFFTNIHGPYFSDDDITDAICEKIEEMALKYADWAKCGYATALYEGSELFTLTFMDDGSKHNLFSKKMGEMKNTTLH